MTPIRLGAVGYLNARPLVFGLDRSPCFVVRQDVPSECARLLHEGEIDVGLIPSVEYLRGERNYSIVPDLAIASRGPVASVALYTRMEPRDIRSIAMDAGSRTSVALAMVLARRAFGVVPETVVMPPDVETMLARADAALIIGDNALLFDHEAADAAKIDLGELWTRSTGLPFVYAFWAGPRDVVTPAAAGALRHARDAGVANIDAIAREYFGDVERQTLAVRYLRDNIRYALGPEEVAGLCTFYRYAAEAGLVTVDGALSFYHASR